MAFCRKCGKELRDGDSVCPQCGTPVSGMAPPMPGPAPNYNPVPPKKTGVSTILVVAVVIGIMAAGIFALAALLPDSGPEPAPAPEGGYDITFDLKDVVLNTNGDTLLNVMQDGKYYNPASGRFDLTAPSPIAKIGLSVVYGDDELPILNVGEGVLADGSSSAISADSVCTLHLDKDVKKLEFTLFMVSCYDSESGSIIDVNSGEDIPMSTGIRESITLDPELTVKEYTLDGDFRPCAVSGSIVITITPMP